MSVIIAEAEENQMKVVFLHIPKTAGQSIHAALEESFGKDRVCPARVNDSLQKMSIAELNSYSVFSGHLDWAFLDCIKGPKYIFTILREPRDRILSFYFYMRKEAAKLPPEVLGLPQNAGKKAAIEGGPDHYFCGGPAHVRSFLDAHYDNFYTYFFAGRHYLARNQLWPLLSRGEMAPEELVDLAKANMKELDGIFSFSRMDEVFKAIRDLSGVEIAADNYRVNANTEVEAGDRLSQLLKLGAAEKTLEKLEQYCLFDNQIWSARR